MYTNQDTRPDHLSCSLRWTSDEVQISSSCGSAVCLQTTRACAFVATAFKHLKVIHTQSSPTAPYQNPE
ncbi:hypothetical protein Mapa_008566 [Marchantia paleacea]|nr:hypothetical protein Mapa_008566 [Marchantia paleacea]